MSEEDKEVEDLISNLGLDQEDVESAEADPDVKEVTTSDTTSAEQLASSDNLVVRCKDIYQKGRENDLAWRWMIGQEVQDTEDNDEKYEGGILKRLSEELDIAISDLSRFRKFFLSFDKDMIIERAKVGYTWSHFKVINDLPDGDIKKRMIAQVEREDEAPKIKDLQQTISDEKNAQLSGLDNDTNTGLGGSTGETSSSSGKSPAKPVNNALKFVEKLSDHLTDIYMQEEAGIDFDTDAKEEKYNELMDELGVKLKEIHELYQKVWSKNDLPDEKGEEDEA